MVFLGLIACMILNVFSWFLLSIAAVVYRLVCYTIVIVSSWVIISFSKFSFFRSSAFSALSWITSYVHGCLGFDTPYAKMTIAHLVIVCTNKLIFGKGHFLVIISGNFNEFHIFTNLVFVTSSPLYSIPSILSHIPQTSHIDTFDRRSLHKWHLGPSSEFSQRTHFMFNDYS